MRIYRTYYWLAAVALLFSLGCATRLTRPGTSPGDIDAERREQLKLALCLLLDRQIRTWRVATQLKTGGVELCGEDVQYIFGFFVLDRETFRDDYRKVAPDIGLESGLRVWEVLADFQDLTTRLKKGDKIVEVDGKPISSFESFAKAMEKPWKTGRLSIKLIRRSGEEVSFSLEGKPACDYRAAVIERDLINAYADGKNVFVTTGLIRFAQSDDELAIVLGHEFAHNALGHVRQMQAQSMAGMLIDLAILVFGGVDTGGLFSQMGRLVYSKDFEADADYMGLYFTARAGYDIQIAPSLWRRMAVEHPGSIKGTWLATHPSTPERAVTLKEIIEEIEKKRAEGLALLPEREEKTPSSKPTEYELEPLFRD